MKRTLATAALMLALAGCGGGDDPAAPAPSPTPDVAACRTALEADFRKAMEDPDAPSATRPPACEGVDDATLQRLAGEIIASAVPSATP